MTMNTKGVTINWDIKHLGRATVNYTNEEYVSIDGKDWFDTEVCINDKANCAVLTAKEALALLEWLKQEEITLQKMADNEANRGSDGQ